MNKKFWAVLVLVVLALGFAGNVWAVDATEASNPEAQPALMYGDAVSGIAKIPAGPRYSKTITNSAIISAIPVRVYTVNIYSDTAGDLAAIYAENTPPVAYLEFEIAIAANTSSKSINLSGLKLPELYIALSDTTNSLVTVTYDY